MTQKVNQSIYSKKEGLLFILPALLGTFLFIIIPIFISFGISFFDWDLLNPPKFVGLENYIQILTEPEYLKIYQNTFIYVACVTIFGVTLPLLLAYLISLKFKFSEEFKLICFLPYITPMIVIGTVWCWIFDPTSGLVNNLFNLNYKWLYDEHFAMPIIIFVSVWKLLGYNTLLYLTGFANINNTVLESAKIDGANNFNILLKIVIPYITPMISFVALTTIIFSFQVFDLIYIMTSGGPNGATDVLVYSIYKEGFEFFEAGKSCALGYILFFIIVFITMLIKKYRNNL